MGILEVILLVAGIVIFIGSFLLPSGRTEEGGINTEAAKEEIKGLVEEEMQTVRGRMQDKMDETSSDALDKAERSLERLTNEKIMAVNEYSDTVLQEIRKNHDEAMFLYDMLNNKHANIKETVSKIDKTVKEAKEAEGKVLAASEEQDKRSEAEETQKMHPDTEEAAKAGTTDTDTSGDAVRNSNDRILEMHRQGMNVVTIAKELGLGVGEVQLVLDLYKD